MENVVYVAPELEVLEVMVEQGFEGSVDGGGFGDGLGGSETYPDW